jgi:hypothetical protein
MSRRIGFFSYVNPKQIAALQIARNIAAHSKNEREAERQVKALAEEDKGLSKRVAQELDSRFGYRISVDS